MANTVAVWLDSHLVEMESALVDFGISKIVLPFVMIFIRQRATVSVMAVSL